MTTYVTRDGSRLTPFMLYQINRLNTDLKNAFGVEVRVTSGIRTHQEQINLFLARYVTAGNVRGRRVYDTRVWKGVRYYRISSIGTVAVPGYSNHEVQGTAAAVDLRDTGRDGGIATMGSKRSNWLRANCGKYGMDPEGFNFGEAWHYRFRNAFQQPHAQQWRCNSRRKLNIGGECTVIRLGEFQMRFQQGIASAIFEFPVDFAVTKTRCCLAG